MAMKCPECGSQSYLIVDGELMSEERLLALPFVPKSIERRLNHALFCPKTREILENDDRRN